jgi:hypothetical protein
MSSKSYNFQAGLLMTALIGAAFVIHHHAEASYLAGGSYLMEDNGRMENSAADSRSLTGKISDDHKTSARGLPQ